MRVFFALVLTTLRIKNLGLVSDLTVEFQPGYNVITGETGAGKSMLIGALSLVLGGRADRSVIRSGTDSCVVEASFDIATLTPMLPEMLAEKGVEPCDGSQLLLKRAINANGANRQFINGSPAPLSVLSEVGEWLVDFHGPHEHQSLLNPAKQLVILDAFGGLEKLRDTFADLMRRRTSLLRERAALVMDERTYARELDLLRFQVNEISAARLHEVDEDELKLEHQRAANAARLLELSQQVLQMLSDDDGGLRSQLGITGKHLHDLVRLDRAGQSLADLHAQVAESLEELKSETARYADKLELDPARLLDLEQRMNMLHGLKRKYGSTVAEIIAAGETSKARLATLEKREEGLARIQSELDELANAALNTGRELSSKRARLLGVLSTAVAGQLADLGFAQSPFEAAMTSVTDEDFQNDPAKATMTGLDSVEFQFSPNRGEPLRPLRSIASSGELARVMLALKTVLAAQDQVPVLVFDEVDANVGGETANSVGRKMRELSQSRQVLCVTHLPQVAAASSAHFVASKTLKDSRTITSITLLSNEERVTELARMLGGQSEAARHHAQALLQAGQSESQPRDSAGKRASRKAKA